MQTMSELLYALQSIFKSTFVDYFLLTFYLFFVSVYASGFCSLVRPHFYVCIFLASISLMLLYVNKQGHNCQGTFIDLVNTSLHL